MKPPFLKIDFPDLERHEALWLLTTDLKGDAYKIEDGRSVGIRNVQLAAKYTELRRQALLGVAQERISAFRESQTRDPDLTKAEPLHARNTTIKE
jgi:hypothetical protein